MLKTTQKGIVVSHISLSELLLLKPLYKLRTSKQFKVFLCKILTCVDVQLTSPCYSFAIKLSNFTHSFQASLIAFVKNRKCSYAQILTLRNEYYTSSTSFRCAINQMIFIRVTAPIHL